MIFLREGVSRFDASLRSAWGSMLIPICLLPLIFWTTQFAVPLGADEVSRNVLVPALLLISVLSLVITIGFYYLCAKYFQKLEAFPRLVTAMNWVGLLFTVLTLPILFMTESGHIDRQTLEDIFIWVLIYQYAVTGFIIFRSYLIPWELAVAVAILTMFINETTRELVFHMSDIPIVDYFDIY